MAHGLQGRTKPAANTLTTLFTATAKIVVTVNACNTASGSTDQCTIFLVPSGATAADQHQIEANTDMAAKAVIERSGIVLNTGDFIQVRSGSGNVSFNCWGVEL